MRISDWSSDVCSSDLARAKNRAAQGLTKLTVDSPVPYLLSDLINAIQTLMGKLDRSGEVAPYMRLRTKIEEIKSDPRYSFMFSGMLVSDTMGQFMSRIFRLPGNGRPISIIDLSGVPSDIVSVVVAVLSRLVRSEEHTSELQSLMRTSYDVFCLKKNK